MYPSLMPSFNSIRKFVFLLRYFVCCFRPFTHVRLYRPETLYRPISMLDTLSAVHFFIGRSHAGYLPRVCLSAGTGNGCWAQHMQLERAFFLFLLFFWLFAFCLSMLVAELGFFFAVFVALFSTSVFFLCSFFSCSWLAAHGCCCGCC